MTLATTQEVGYCTYDTIANDKGWSNNHVLMTLTLKTISNLSSVIIVNKLAQTLNGTRPACVLFASLRKPKMRKAYTRVQTLVL